MASPCVVITFYFFFFFSSRRRHTRFDCDWSSDVCSSDLRPTAGRRMRVGHVWLVGAGPGDPGLMTVRGLEALRGADVVVYDRLVNPTLLDEAPAEALRISHCLPQEDINALLIAHARRGHSVVRLKGGDPF